MTHFLAGRRIFQHIEYHFGAGRFYKGVEACFRGLQHGQFFAQRPVGLQSQLNGCGLLGGRFFVQVKQQIFGGKKAHNCVKVSEMGYELIKNNVPSAF